MVAHAANVIRVRSGRLYGLSLSVGLDRGDIVAVLPTGRLVLSLTKETYEQLGLQGKRSRFEKEVGALSPAYAHFMSLQGFHLTHKLRLSAA
jgi:hypothetical protein